MTRWIAVSLATAIVFGPGIGRAETGEQIVAPPPVSGRTLATPSSITSADVLARVKLIRENLELIRKYMGRPAPPKPLLRVEGAHPREVYLQTYNLVRRSRQLGFEHLRTPQEALAQAKKNIVPALNLELLNEVLVTTLRVKRSLGIEEAVAEQAQQPNTTPTDVFNNIVETGRLLDSLLDKQTNDDDIFVVTTIVFNLAASLHAQATKRFLPREPEFEPNKNAVDVYRVLYRCFTLTSQLAQRHGLKMLRFSVTEDQILGASTNNNSELAVLLIAELIHIYRGVLKAEPTVIPYHSGRRFPAHSVQRAAHLELVLKSLVAAAKP